MFAYIMQVISDTQNASVSHGANQPFIYSNSENNREGRWISLFACFDKYVQNMTSWSHGSETQVLTINSEGEMNCDRGYAHSEPKVQLVSYCICPLSAHQTLPSVDLSNRHCNLSRQVPNFLCHGQDLKMRQGWIWQLFLTG